MPLYNYECEKCNYIFEYYTQLIKNDNPQCSKCGNNTKKLLSKPVMIGSDGPRNPSTPIDSNPKGTIAAMAHVADRNTGKSLGFVPAGVINE